MARTLDIRRPHRRTKPPRKKKGVAGFGIGALVIAIFIFMLFRLMINRNNQPSTTPTDSAQPSPMFTPKPTTTLGPIIPTVTPSPTETPTVSPAPSPSPSPEIDKATIGLRILNGSGVPGRANLLMSELEAQGFQVRTTAVARTRRATAIIYYTPGKEPEARLVRDGIGDTEIEIVENESLTAPDDVLVVVGAN